MKVYKYEDLEVYKLAFELQQEIFQLTKKFPKEELFSLTDQIRRSSRSVGANIAESWQKRRYKAHFISKLTDSDSEQAETRHWLKTCLSCGYINTKRESELQEKYIKLGAMLGKMINDADSWCL
jgi:four helix bundle protein